jgi:hypothetical protein
MRNSLEVRVRDNACGNSSFVLILFKEKLLAVNFVRHDKHIKIVIGSFHQILPIRVVLIFFMP